MLIENSFTIAGPVEEVWRFLLDVDRIAPCMPGAEITEAVDERTWKGKVTVKLGPVALSFAGSVQIDERDDTAHRLQLHARGTEQKGKGAANVKVTSWLEPDGDGTTVMMESDITLSGAAAQLSRGLVPEVSKRLTQQFADCLEASFKPVTAPPRAEPSPASKPVGGIRLGAGAMWTTIVGFFRRLFGRRERADR